MPSFGPFDLVYRSPLLTFRTLSRLGLAWSLATRCYSNPSSFPSLLFPRQSGCLDGTGALEEELLLPSPNFLLPEHWSEKPKEGGINFPCCIIPLTCSFAARPFDTTAFRPLVGFCLPSPFIPSLLPSSAPRFGPRFRGGCGYSLIFCFSSTF